MSPSKNVKGSKSKVKIAKPLKKTSTTNKIEDDNATVVPQSKRTRYNKENVTPVASTSTAEDIEPVAVRPEATVVNEKELEKLEKAKKKLEEQQQMQVIKREQSFKALRYLLSKSVIYTKFLEESLEASSKPLKAICPDSPETPILEEPVIKKMKQPNLFENGTLRDYQLDAIEWLKLLFKNGINGILADEMGLGKTVQVIAFLCYLYERGVKGPFLICAPLSTVPNWSSEFERFAPKLPVVLYHGNKEARKKLDVSVLRRNYLIGNINDCSPVVLTGFDAPVRDAKLLSRRSWKYIIVDEGHRLKNHETILFKTLHSYKTMNRLIITGTPLQNNLRELWSLLHFLLPDIFSDYEIFESWMDVDELKNNFEKFIKQEEETQVLSMMHNILKPFMLRRLKIDVELGLPPKKEVIVYCPLTQKQRDLYKFVLDGDMKALNPDRDEFTELLSKRKRRRKSYKECDDNDSDFEYNSEEDDCPVAVKKPERDVLTRLTMTNKAMMFRKIVNHPYLIHFPIVKGSTENKGKPELRIDEDLIKQSGKMMMLDAMTSKLIKTGHKILIFSTLNLILDLIEDFVIMRNYNYRRLDGTYSLEKRKVVIKEFNTDPDVKIFLVSTRAGGLGLNLVGADTVILYDSDWNPQADLQAQDRCHRIGQTRPVLIYQYVSRGTIDETIVATGDKKRKLEKLIIQSDKFKLNVKSKDTSQASSLEYLKKLLLEDERHVASSSDELLSEKELDVLLDRSELYEQMKHMIIKKL